MATIMQSDWDLAPNSSQRLTAGRLVLLASLAALGSLATNIMLPAFPAIAREFGVAPRELAWTLSSFFVVFAVGQLFVGPLADAVGRTPLVVAGLAIFMTGSVVCTLAPSLPALILGRAIQALGACAASVLARAIARDLYHGPELTRTLALVMIATAAAPGFSPALGAGMALALGWRSAFVLVAVAAAGVALHFRLSLGETLPPGRRRPSRSRAIARTYVELTLDPRFIFPALTVSLVIGCLFSFFGAAPTILMNDMGLSGTSLSIFFAATVFVVFGSGLVTSRLSRRWGAPRVGMAGVMIALAGGLWLLIQAGGAPALAPFMAAVTMFLGGMGLINPIGTAITLEPFGDRAGVASALLGFLQMTCAAVGTAIIGALPVGAATAFAAVVFGGTALAAAAFLPVLRTGAVGSVDSAVDRRAPQPAFPPTDCGERE
ncbi:MAG TPA: multidrug effflux MFS transporter [Caulobacteraceae bacterium]|nr:multidrug effflux MFS transporter [Caulobacteraceae bacterium]